MGKKSTLLCDSPLCRGGIVVIKFTKPRKLPRHCLVFYCGFRYVSNMMMLVSLGVMLTVIYVDYTNFHPTLNMWSAKENASYALFTAPLLCNRGVESTLCT